MDFEAHDFVYGERVESFHDAVQSAPTGVGSSAGVEASSEPEDAGFSADGECVDAKAVAVKSGRRVKSLIVSDGRGYLCYREKTTTDVRLVGLYDWYNSCFRYILYNFMVSKSMLSSSPNPVTPRRCSVSHINRKDIRRTARRR